MTWAGRKVVDARAYWRRLLPLPCYRCQQPVLPGQRWHVEHIIDRALGGREDDRNTQWVSHGRCNESAGGKLAAELRRTRAADTDTTRRENRPLTW